MSLHHGYHVLVYVEYVYKYLVKIKTNAEIKITCTVRYSLNSIDYNIKILKYIKI
jgi:hypothetical protein